MFQRGGPTTNQIYLALSCLVKKGFEKARRCNLNTEKDQSCSPPLVGKWLQKQILNDIGRFVEIGHVISILCQFPIHMYNYIISGDITNNMILNYKNKLLQIGTINNQQGCETTTVINELFAKTTWGYIWLLFAGLGFDRTEWDNNGTSQEHVGILQEPF